MRRRDFIKLIAGSAAAWPLAARAQETKVARIGVLSPFLSSTPPSAGFNAFKQTLQELGWIEGKSVAFEYRWSEGHADRLPGLAAELVRLNPDPIFCPWGTPTAVAAKNATQKIPIVFAGLGDAVGVGLVASLAQPGGNITGATIISEETVAKLLELLREMNPELARVAILVNLRNPVYRPVLSASEAPAKALHLRLQTLSVGAVNDLDRAFEEAAKEGAEGLVVMRDPVIVIAKPQVVALAAQRRLLAVYGMRDFVDAGGLISYGPNLADMYRHVAHTVDQILRGAKPGDLPVEQAARFELVVNLKTAKTLGFTIPTSILIRADEVIE